MESITKVCFVAIGGAVGAVTRYLFSVSPLQNIFEKFPFPTFAVNILGSFLVGLAYVLLFEKHSINENIKLAVLVGFIGSFTTFATFELEFWNLAKSNDHLQAFSYLFLSVLIGFAALIVGMNLAKTF